MGVQAQPDPPTQGKILSRGMSPSRVRVRLPLSEDSPMNPARMFIAVLVLSAASLWAQNPAAVPGRDPSLPGAQPPALTYTVEVTDKAGRFVSGLQPGDFTLLDNGSPSRIEAFAEHTPAPQSPETVLLLIDTVNMGFDGDSIARLQLIDFLRGFKGPLPYPISLLSFTDTGIAPLGAPSTDPKALLAELQSQQGQLRSITRAAGFWGAAEREERSVISLSHLALAMEKIPGRKLLIWIGPGWPIFDSPNITYSDSQLRRIFAKVVSLSNDLTQAQATVYHVDPLGGWDAGSFRTFLWESYKKPVRRWQSALPGNLAVQVLATQSGGLVLNGSNDVAGEVSHCARDGEAWYTITFAPQTSEKPDTWHSVKVKLDKPGLTVRMRPGYYAQP